MPELPEVETIKNDLNKLIVGREILAIESDSLKQVKPSLAVVKKAIVNAKIKKICRRAKLIQVFLDNNKILLIHLKLTGRLLVRKQKEPEDKWQRVIIDLSGGKQLRLVDLRKFGWIKLVKDKKELAKILVEFGPEPGNDLPLADFKKILQSTRRPVKVVIMDQKKISGVGNIYAADALFLAGVDPRRPANEMTPQEAKKLLAAIEKVFKAGIKYRGASDQHYLDALGHKGKYQEHFLVYNRQGKPCWQCKAGIKKIKLAGRGTYFCPRCQK